MLLLPSGAKPNIFFAILAFGGSEVEIMYLDPSFPIYESVIRYSGAIPVPVSLHENLGFSFKAENILSQITEQTRLIIINSPNNPTGGVIPKKEIDKLVCGLLEYPDVTILSDEIYSQFIYEDKTHTSLLQYPDLCDRVIVIDGWSTTYAMPGWRIGYAVWPENMAELITRFCINDHSCVNRANQ